MKPPLRGLLDAPTRLSKGCDVQADEGVAELLIFVRLAGCRLSKGLRTRRATGRHRPPVTRRRHGSGSVAVSKLKIFGTPEAPGS
jgi:hypothetical protein